MLRLDEKLKNIRKGRYKPTDFIIADAKDGDMGSGAANLGFDRSDPRNPRPRRRQQYVEAIEQVLKQDIVDIMLTSASNFELLQERGAFDGTRVKAAIRANDATDIWGAVRHGSYATHPSRPFRSANLARVMYGTPTPKVGAKVTGTDLGLYSITFVNDLDSDMRSLEAFSQFRDDCAAIGFKYFYEVFNPNVDTGLSREQIGEYVNDCILRSLAGVQRADRPQFLKIAFNGPKALEELASFDSELVVGVLGGGAGTTRDTFELVSQAERHGARIALFGRKINLAEDPLALLVMMRRVAERHLSPEEAVRAYHGELQKQMLEPARNLEDDRQITEEVLQPGATLRAA